MKYVLYDAPDYPDVPYEFDARGIFLKAIAEASIRDARGLLLSGSGSSLFRRAVPRLSFGRKPSDFRIAMGVFVDPLPALREAKYTRGNLTMQLVDAISACGSSMSQSLKMADVFRELKPVAMYGYDLDLVLVLEQ